VVESGPLGSGVGNPEMGRLLLRHREPRHSCHAAEQLGRPAARGDHRLPRGEHLGAPAAVEREPDAAVEYLQLHHLHVVPYFRPVSGRQALEGRQREFGIELPAVRHVQHLRVEADAAPPLAGFRRRQEFGLQASLVQRRMHRLQRRVRAVIDDAGARQQLLATLVFEFAPQLQGLREHGDVVRFRIGQTEVPGCAVRRTDAVSGPELLQQRDRPAAPGQSPGRGGTHGPAANDHSVHGGAQDSSKDPDVTSAAVPRRSWPERPRRW
jgi:hypothetical protein